MIHISKILLLLAVCHFISSSYAFQILQISDCQSNEPIPYGNIFMKAAGIGFTTDSMGLRRIDLKKWITDNDTVICSAFGYEKNYTVLDKYNLNTYDTIKVMLNPKPIELPEIPISPKNGTKVKRHVIGKRNNHGLFKCLYYDMDSTFLMNDFTSGYEIKTNKGFSELTKFGFYIMPHQQMLSNMKFRINIYDMAHISGDSSDNFIPITEPLYVVYSKEKVKDNKFTYEFSNPVILPQRAMVEIEFLEPMNGEYIITKGNGIGKSVWNRVGINQWRKDPFDRPFFLEINTYK